MRREWGGKAQEREQDPRVLSQSRIWKKTPRIRKLECEWRGGQDRKGGYLGLLRELLVVT